MGCCIVRTTGATTSNGSEHENVGDGAFHIVNITGSPTRVRSTDGTGDIIDVTNVDTIEVHHTVALKNDGGGTSLLGSKTSISGDVLLGLKSITPGTDVSLDVTAGNITINFDSSGGNACKSFLSESTATKTTTSTNYQLVTTFAAIAEILDTEVWEFTCFIYVCHPPNVFTPNTQVRFQIETAPNVWADIDPGWQVATPISISGDKSSPATFIKKVTAQMDTPRVRVHVRVTAAGLATGTFVEDPRVEGDRCAA